MGTRILFLKCWIAANDKETLKTLKSYGFDINARDEKGHTPLITILDQNLKNGQG